MVWVIFYIYNHINTPQFTLSYLEITSRYFILLLALTAPLYCIYSFGLLSSYSQYWTTPMQPLFIIANILTAYYMFNFKVWRIPSILLMLITFFPLFTFNITHNSLAVLFFLSCLVPLFKSKRYTYIKWVYLAGALVMFKNLMVGEWISIFAITLHHFLLLTKSIMLDNKKHPAH